METIKEYIKKYIEDGAPELAGKVLAYIAAHPEIERVLDTQVRRLYANGNLAYVSFGMDCRTGKPGFRTT